MTKDLDLIQFETKYDMKLKDILYSIIDRNHKDRIRMNATDKYLQWQNQRIDTIEYAFLMSRDKEKFEKDEQESFDKEKIERLERE